MVRAALAEEMKNMGSMLAAAGAALMLLLALVLWLARGDDRVNEPVSPGTVVVAGDEVKITTPEVTIVKRYPAREGAKVRVNSGKIAALSARSDSLAAAIGELEERAGPESPELGMLREEREKIRVQLADPERYGLVAIQTRGFCLRPMIGAGYDGKMDFFLGCKTAYWQQWGLVAGSTRSMVGAGISRHIDFLPVVPRSLEGIALYGVRYEDGRRAVFGGVGVTW